MNEFFTLSLGILAFMLGIWIFSRVLLLIGTFILLKPEKKKIKSSEPNKDTIKELEDYKYKYKNIKDD